MAPRPARSDSLPPLARASRELMRAGKSPTAIHNNCSGKHAGMLATAVHRGLDPRGYERLDHPVQQEIRRVVSETCGVALEDDAIGIDGCSVPTFALPLAAVATGFARLASGRGLEAARAEAAQQLMQACFAAPDLVAGEGRFDTIVMRGLPDLAFAKGGAEGVHCAALPALGIGVAVKVGVSVGVSVNVGVFVGVRVATAMTLRMTFVALVVFWNCLPSAKSLPVIAVKSPVREPKVMMVKESPTLGS